MYQHTVTFTTSRQLFPHNFYNLCSEQNWFNPSISSREEANRLHIQYPIGGARTIKTVCINFDIVPPRSQVENIENIIKYWSSLPFVTKREVQHVNFVEKTAFFNVDCSSSTSSDIDARCILELLASYLTHGTTLRLNNTRAFNGLGKELKIGSVTGLSS